jgi:hypothetical protein
MGIFQCLLVSLVCRKMGLMGNLYNVFQGCSVHLGSRYWQLVL